MPTKCLSISGENGLSRPSCHVIKNGTRNVFTEFPAWRHVSGPLNRYEIAALAKMHWTMHLRKQMHTIAVLRQWLWNNFSGSGTIWHLWPVFLLATAIAFFQALSQKGFHKMTTAVMLHQISDSAPNYQHQKGQNAKPGFAGMPPIQLHGSILLQNSGFVDAGTHGCAGTSLEICVVYTHNMVRITPLLRTLPRPPQKNNVKGQKLVTLQSYWIGVLVDAGSYPHGINPLQGETTSEKDPMRQMRKDLAARIPKSMDWWQHDFFFSCWIYKTNRCTLDKIQLTRMKNTWETH